MVVGSEETNSGSPVDDGAAAVAALKKVRLRLDRISASVADDADAELVREAFECLSELEGALAPIADGARRPSSEAPAPAKTLNSAIRLPSGKKAQAKYWWAARLMDLLPPSADILELGCGSGKPVGRMLAQQSRYTGVEIVAARAQRMQRAVPEATILNSDYTELDFAPETFDAVVATYTFRQIGGRDLEALLKRIGDWLRPGGYLLATVGPRSLVELAPTVGGWRSILARTRGGSLDEAGLTLVDHEIVEPDARRLGRSRREVWVLAQRAARP
jgi:SAM-dependent methyltransferase